MSETQGTDGATNNTEAPAAEAVPTFQDTLGDHGSNEAFAEMKDVGNLAEAYLSNRSEMAELRDSMPQVPESYELEMEGLDEDAVNSFKDVAKDMGLSQEQAAKVLDFNKQRLATLVEGAKEAEAKVEADLKSEWGGEFDKNLNLAKRAIDAFTDDNFKTFLEDTRLGSHPEMIKLFHNLGAKLSEDTFSSDGTSNVSKDRKRASDGKAMLSFPSMET